MDSFTKWAEAFPLRNKEAETIARVLVEQVFSRFGIPLSILSDQGKEVDGRIMREVCRLFGIEKLRTMPYKPSTNQVERFHRTLNSILGKTVAEHQKDWDTRLVFALSAYRATRHRATGYSPNFLVLGRETRAPPDVIYGRPETGNDYDSFVEQTRDRLVQAYDCTREQLQQSAGYNKRYYDVGVKPSRFKAGQWVWYFNPRKLRGKQMKWTQQYEGPYLILEMLSPLVAKIQQSSRTKPKIVHIDKLKKYEGEEPKMWSTAEVAVATQRDRDREGATGPYIPSFSVSERSRESMEPEEISQEYSRSDEVMAMVCGVEDCIDASGESSVSRTSTRSTVGEAAVESETWENDRVEVEDVLQGARPDQPTSTPEVQYNDEDNSYFRSTAGPGSVEPDEDYGESDSNGTGQERSVDFEESEGEEVLHNNTDTVVSESGNVSNEALNTDEWSGERQRPTRATRRPTRFRDYYYYFRPEEKRKRCNWLGRGDQARGNADKFYKHRKKKEPYNHLGRGDEHSAAQRMTDSLTQLASPSRYGSRQRIKTDQAKKTGNRC